MHHPNYHLTIPVGGGGLKITVGESCDNEVTVRCSMSVGQLDKLYMYF